MRYPYNDCNIYNTNNIIYITETYDVTTIRASLPQYKLCKYISKHTDIKILLIGDGSDELTGGYKYYKSNPIHIYPQEFPGRTPFLTPE